MITVRLIGGLGNQMFQYAAGLSLARRLRTELRLDVTGFEKYPLRPYLLDRLNVPQVMARTRLPSSRMARALRRLRGGRREYRTPTFSFDPAFETLADGAALNGDFQSWRYFVAVEAELRTQFTLRQPLSANAQGFAEKISATRSPISVHVRRGDYLTSQNSAIHGVLDLDYYRRAMAMMNAMLGDAKFFLFSDDPDWAGTHLRDFGAVEVIRDQDASPWEDMALMSACQHHIIANSSFSWWGAWLDPSPIKQVIAPRQWFAPPVLRRNNTADLLPSGWIAL